jgi:hypothetical protein
LYAAWPIRFYIIVDGQIRYIANPINGSFDIVELREKIAALVSQ